MVTGINHITLSVRALEPSLKFYQTLLGFRLLAKWDQGAYLAAGDLWLCLTLDDRTRAAPLPEYSHVAFNVRQKDFATMAISLSKAHVEIWQENTSEGDSLYILDPNGHKLELHCTSLADRLAATKAAPYKGMIFYDD